MTSGGTTMHTRNIVTQKRDVAKSAGASGLLCKHVFGAESERDPPHRYTISVRKPQRSEDMAEKRRRCLRLQNFYKFETYTVNESMRFLITNPNDERVMV